MILLLLLPALLAGVRASSDGSYFITAPTMIQRGSTYDVAVSITNSSDEVAVEASLKSQVYDYTRWRYDYVLIKNVSGIFNKGESGVLSMEIEPDLSCPACSLSIRGKGGLQFERVIYPYLSSFVLSVMVQTDKSIYKPGQTVYFRVLAVYSNLKVYEGSFDIEVYDASGNKIQIWNGVSNTTGVFEGSLVLSDQPVLGDWRITAAATETKDLAIQNFVIAEYVLPKFEVKVELPSYALTSDAGLAGTVKATFTFGQPVKGSVELHVGPNTGPDYCGRLPATVQKGFKIDGEADFSVSKADIQRALYIYDRTQVKVTAIVTDVTGTSFNGSSTITFYQNPYFIQFLDNTPNTFKPGVPYQAYLQVTTPDGKPPTVGGQVKVYPYITYSFTDPDQSFYSIYQFSGTLPLPPQIYNLSQTGVVTVDLEIPANATSVYLTAYYDKTQLQTSKFVSKMTSPSNNYIQLSLLAKNVKSNMDVPVKVDGTEPLSNVSYTILSRGTVIETGTVDGEGQRSFIFTIAMTPAMGPTAHLIVYYLRAKDPGGIVLDSVAFNVDDIYENKVSIAFGKNESQPGEKEKLIVSATPGSVVNVLAVDKSVLLMKSGNDITQDKVQEAVYRFDTGPRPSSSEYALSFSDSNVNSVFNNMGLMVITDHNLNDQPVYYPEEPSMEGATSPSTGMPAQSPEPQATTTPVFSVPPQENFQTVERVRQDFPETWLWFNTITSNSSQTEIEVQVPDSLTTWFASAFAVHSVKGLGVAATSSQLEVSLPFFVTLAFPNVVIRGEQAVIQATVFNYLSQELKVVVKLKGSDCFRSVLVTVDEFNEKLESYQSGDQYVDITVRSQEQGVVYFALEFLAVGMTNIEVSASSILAADAERKPIYVQSEGAPVSFNYPFFIQLNASDISSFTDSISFPLPSAAVPDSAEVNVKVTGDLCGPTLYGIQTLLRIPTGCGEQIMMRSATNLYITQYLDSTGQLSSYQKDRAIEVLKNGYQSQLTNQRYDGSFSPFGNFDETGHTWLTAYVLEISLEALKYIYIDTNVLFRGLDWLVDRQNSDGSFSEFGQVLDRQTQGAGKGPRLTAFVLVALLQYEKVAPRDSCNVDNANCYRVYRYGNATRKATQNLEKLFASGSIQAKFELAIVCYALTLAKSPKAEAVFSQLEASAIQEGDFLFWKETTTQVDCSTYVNWTPVRAQAKTTDILTTSYASLAMTELGHIEECLPVIRWLTSQRNADGGFGSSQDTVVAIHAVSSYASATIRPDINLNIVVSADEQQHEFIITNVNTLLVQVQQLENTASSALITASGHGLALLEIEHSFHVTSDLTTPSFEVNPIILDENTNFFKLMICSKWVCKRESGMVVQQVSILSGFLPDLSGLNRVAGVKRSEIKGNTVVVYFDQISQASICYTITFSRAARVARSQAGYILTYDYYQPYDRAMSFYLPKSIEQTTVCDVVDGYCPGPVTSSTSPTTTDSSGTAELSSTTQTTPLIYDNSGLIYKDTKQSAEYPQFTQPPPPSTPIETTTETTPVIVDDSGLNYRDTTQRPKYRTPQYPVDTTPPLPTSSPIETTTQTTGTPETTQNMVDGSYLAYRYTTEKPRSRKTQYPQSPEDTTQSPSTHIETTTPYFHETTQTTTTQSRRRRSKAKKRLSRSLWARLTARRNHSSTRK